MHTPITFLQLTSARFCPRFYPFGPRSFVQLLPMLSLLFFVKDVRCEVFKWTASDGKTHYSNLPPPANAQAEKKQLSKNASDTSNLPYEVAQAAKTNPVLLYTGVDCIPCDEGRKLLSTRGVPFAEKTVSTNADVALLGKGSVELPQLTVGAAKQSGFEAGAWNKVLSNAGYPLSNQLSKNYRNPAPQAAAPIIPANQTEGTAAATADTIATEPAARPIRQQPLTPPTNNGGETSLPGLRF